MSRRQEATEFILKNIGKLLPGNTTNVEITKKFLDDMTDTEFGNYMEKLSRPYDEDGAWLRFFEPNLSGKKVKLEVARNIELAESLGYSMWQRVWYQDPVTGDMVLSRKPVLIVDLPVRRQAQLQEVKESTPLHDRVRDELSGQVTGESKGAKLSFPELQALVSQGLDEPIVEMAKVRGGDDVALREMSRQILETGSCSLDVLMGLGSRPKSADTLRSFLLGMHLDTNL